MGNLRRADDAQVSCTWLRSEPADPQVLVEVRRCDLQVIGVQAQVARDVGEREAPSPTLFFVPAFP